MSLLFKIRRRRKAKKLPQANPADGVAAAFSVDDVEEDDGDSDRSAIAGQADMQCEHMQIEETSSADAGREEDASEESSSSAPAYATKIVYDSIKFGRESGFWTRIVKTAILVLASLGAFYIGKMATLGITLSIWLVFKLFTSNWIQRSKVWSQKEVIPARCSSERNRTSHEIMSQDGDEVDEPLQRSLIGSENMDEELDVMVNLNHNIGSIDSLTTKQKQLKRLNCIKLPSSVSSLDEVKEESPSSSASPRTWFRNRGSPMITGNKRDKDSSEFRRSVEIDSKALIRRLRKMGPASAPSSPSRSSTESIGGFSIASDGSDTERAINGHLHTVRRKSKFRPASPVEELSGTDSSKAVKQRGLENLLFGEYALHPSGIPSDSTTAGEGRKANNFTAAFYKAKLKRRNRKPLSQEEMPSTVTSQDSAAFVGLAAVTMSTQETLRQRREMIQSVVNSAPLLQVSNVRDVKTVTKPSSTAVPLNKRRGKLQNRRYGTVWLTLDLVIITSGLLMGRMVAVAALIFYWYALSSLKSNNAGLENRRNNPSL